VIKTVGKPLSLIDLLQISRLEDLYCVEGDGAKEGIGGGGGIGKRHEKAIELSGYCEIRVIVLNYQNEE
jgi:hypothetical protein